MNNDDFFIPVSVITGVSGMDGSILAKKLLEHGHEVIGIDTWRPEGQPKNIKDVVEHERFTLETGDICEKEFIHRIITQYRPDYFYNLAAISLVPESFKIPQRIFEVNTMAVLHMLETIRTYSPDTRFYQASTSEQIGANTQERQNTDSKMLPNSPYAIAKLASFHLVRMYREAYNLFSCNGMLWNHEGEKRGPTFVTRKVSMAVANISKGKQEKVVLGNLDTGRDWGYADDYVEAMITMMESDEPDDFAVATGETHTIRELVEEAFSNIGEEITWEEEGVDEVGVNQDGIVRVEVSKQFYRPLDVLNLNGDPTKITEKLGWRPKVTFKELIRLMVEHDLEEVSK